MNNDRDALIEKLGMGISRRKMLKGMGYGVAGAMVAPSLIESVLAAPQRATVSLSDLTPQPIWSYTDSDSDHAYFDSPLFDTGTIVIPARNIDEGVLYSIDTQTKEVRWTYPTGEPFLTPLSAGGVLYAATNTGSLYAIDPATGTTRWQKNDYRVVTDLKLIGGNLVFTTTQGNLMAVDLQGPLRSTSPAVFRRPPP